ncbi:hypothetical protein ABW19_dt0204261 [Dactylella cylindrospora]|nr:hypothetical protein ABW19_dt0204261 [Dactylella cylindrospora]
MEATTQENSASFEALKALLNESAPTAPKEPLGGLLAKGKRLSSEETQEIPEITDEDESDDATTRRKRRASSPATSLLTNVLDLEPTQSSPIQKSQPRHTGDSQLPNTLLTDGDTGVDRTPHIQLDYSPDKLTNQNYDMEETQKDPDSYNDRMRDNVTSVAEASGSLLMEETLNTDRIFDSPSQPPVYFDERKRFSNVGLLARKQGEGSDDDEEIIVPVGHLQDNSLPIGLTQMFEASSPQRPVTGSSVLPTSPRLGFTSPAPPKEPLTNAPRSSALQVPTPVANHYVSVEESQAERERRRRKISYPEDAEDDDEFGIAPSGLAAKLRNKQREKDSIEQFKEISVARPPPLPKGTGRRGRPPKNRVLEPLLPPSDERSSPPLQPSKLPVVDEEQSAGGDESTADEEVEEEPELEVPGTMEAVITEVKKTQSSQYRPDGSKNGNVEDFVSSSQMEAVADSQPETTAKAAAELHNAEVEAEVHAIVGNSSSFFNPKHTRRRNVNIVSSSPISKSSAPDIPSSSPPVRRSARREGLVIKSSPFPEVSNRKDTAASTNGNDETPRATRNRAPAASNINQLETPFPAQKIPSRIPTTIPATSPYNRDNLLSNMDTPVPMTRRKRKAIEEVPSSVDLVPTGANSSADKAAPDSETPTKAPQNQSKDEGLSLPRSKRSRPNNLRNNSRMAVTESSKGQGADTAQSLNQQEERELSLAPTEPEEPTEMDISPPAPEKPALKLDTTTPQKATIPFKPTDSEKRELDSGLPLRVFAQWEQSYYPAVVHQLPKYEDSTPTRFVGGEIPVRLDRMKKLELRSGDDVRVKGQRQKVWIVQEVYRSSPATGSQTKTESQLEREEVLDIYGNDKVKLKHKNSDEVIDTHIGNIILTAAQFYHLKTSTVAVEQSVSSTEETPLFRKEDSLLDTPSKASRRSTPNVAVDGQKLKTLKFPQGTKLKQGIFSGMRFTVSLPSQKDDQAKAALSTMLQKNGGYILEDGFQEIFETPDDDTTELIPRQGYDSIQFTAVISDRSSTTLKYCQALALGLPCLAVRWVEDSVQADMALPWQDYLLPAGESQYLDGAVKSRVIDWIDLKAATFANMFSRRRKLMDGMNVIFHEAKGKRKSEPQPYRFLIHAMGPAHVRHIKSAEAVNDILRANNPKIKWHFVFSKEDKSRFNAKRKGRDLEPVRIVSDEWLKQCLIMGMLLDDDF